MTTGEYTPLLRSGSSRSSGTQHHIPITSHYFDITDIESWPIAGLLVMLDGMAQPVRAELHLYDELQPHVQDAAIRQARLILQEKYLGGAPVPVRILETFQVREEMIVRLPPLGARSGHVASYAVSRAFSLPRQWRQYGVLGGTVLGLILVVWLVIGLMSGGRADDGSDLAATTTTANSQAQSQQAAEVSTDNNTQADIEPAVETASAPGDVGLPVSRNARGDLRIGMRVQPVPGLRVALRTEPGIDTGTTFGELADGDTAMIVGGPEYRQGDTDTIVWWFIELPNGVQAWTAANTSLQTLLMPAP